MFPSSCFGWQTSIFSPLQVHYAYFVVFCRSSISSSFTAGVHSSLAMVYVRISGLITYHFLAVLASPPKACGHFLSALGVADCTVKFSFVLAVHEIGKGTVFTSLSVSRLTERLLCTLQAFFVAGIIIDWLPLTNIPHVYRIVYRQPASPKLDFGTGMAITVVPKPTRPD